jgi:hypothetical protein
MVAGGVRVQVGRDPENPVAPGKTQSTKATSHFKDPASMSRILWVWFFYFESVHREIASESPFFAAP